VSVYLSGAGVAEAQAVVDGHPVAAATGRCVRCDVVAPCIPLHTALRTFAVSRRLPRRTPGATLPERITLRRVW
jgi:hypothetical protein